MIAGVEDARLFYRVNQYHGDAKGANGLSIYFPSGNDWDTTYSGLFDETAFGMECHWDEFLLYYYNRENAKETPPGVALDSPIPGELVAGKTYTVTGHAYDLQDTPSVESTTSPKTAPLMTPTSCWVSSTLASSTPIFPSSLWLPIYAAVTSAITPPTSNKSPWQHRPNTKKKNSPI